MGLYSPYSKSKLDKYLTCPYQYKKMYSGEVPRKTGYIAEMGQVLHEVIGEWLERGMKEEDLMPLDYLVALPDPQMQPIEALKIYQNAKKMFVDYIYSTTIDKWEVEKKVAIDQNNVPVEFDSKDAYFRGVIDLILYHKDGSIEIFDWKTGYKKQDFLQLNLYAYIMKEINPFWNIKNVGYLYPRNEKISEGAIRSEEMKYSIQWIHNTVQKIEKDQRFIATFGKHCDYCDITHLCPYTEKIPRTPEERMEQAVYFSKMASKYKKEVREYCSMNDCDVTLPDGSVFGINPKTNKFGELKKAS